MNIKAPPAARSRSPGPRPPVRFDAILLLGLALVCAGPPVQAAPQAPELLAALKVPGFEWDARQAMQLGGVPVYVQRFSSSDSVLQAAQTLARHSGLFGRVLKIKGKIVLSGLHDGWHWLAEIDARGSGSGGCVSALRVAAPEGAGPVHPAEPFAWLPRQAARQFDHRNIVEGRQVVQQIYSVALPVRALADHLRGQLRSAGWTPEPEPAGMNAGESTAWRRNGARLMLFLFQAAAGTSLYVHYAE